MTDKNHVLRAEGLNLYKLELRIKELTMSTRKMILGLVVCLSLGVFAQRLLSQGVRSGGSSGGSDSMQSRGTRPQRMPGQPAFERMQKMSPEEKMKYFQQLQEEQRKAAEEQESIAMQQALGADDET